MIDIDLVNKHPNVQEYNLLTKESYPALFLGFIIKNEYDNQRIQLNTEYNPTNLVHTVKSKEGVYGIAMKGILLKPNEKVLKLFKAIQEQEKLSMNLVIYENLLSQFNFACKETYSYFSKGLYPIDFTNLKSICDDSFNTDKKIFQHLLGIEENIFDFQKFADLKVLILTV